MKKSNKYLKIILIIIWMIIIFIFSSENGNKSENTSRKITDKVIELVTDEEAKENKILVENTDKIIRKLAHYSIYTVGGVLIMSYAYTIGKNRKPQILYSIIFGASYAITDEIHQFFVSERSARIFDVGIDTLGVITGILIYLVLRKTIEIFKEIKK